MVKILPVGQMVKTSPSQGEIAGSTPVRVIKKTSSCFHEEVFLFAIKLNFLVHTAFDVTFFS